MKICTKCGKSHPLDMYSLRASGSHRRRAACKNCYNEYMRTYKRGGFFKLDEPETKIQKTENANIAQPNRINIWDLPVYVSPKWGR